MPASKSGFGGLVLICYYCLVVYLCCLSLLLLWVGLFAYLCAVVCTLIDSYCWQCVCCLYLLAASSWSCSARSSWSRTCAARWWPPRGGNTCLYSLYELWYTNISPTILYYTYHNATCLIAVLCKKHCQQKGMTGGSTIFARWEKLLRSGRGVSIIYGDYTIYIYIHIYVYIYIYIYIYMYTHTWRPHGAGTTWHPPGSPGDTHNAKSKDLIYNITATNMITMIMAL